LIVFAVSVVATDVKEVDGATATVVAAGADADFVISVADFLLFDEALQDTESFLLTSAAASSVEASLLGVKMGTIKSELSFFTINGLTTSTKVSVLIVDLCSAFNTSKVGFHCLGEDIVGSFSFLSPLLEADAVVFSI
jgi:hypothetical protein